MEQTSNKTIAKNASLLYVRMFISMAISFYTSRIVLEALGVQDYGIYNLVGGVIVFINSITGALSLSTSRYLTYSLGSEDSVFQKKTFSTAFYIHLLLAIGFILIGESIGLWFVNTQLIIPANRMVAANWVYQAALISTFLSITQVPYNSTITAHEKFNVFAYIEIVNSLLKLLIAFVVLYSIVDHLILYSILYAVLSILIMVYYRFYCVNHFEETHIGRWDKSLSRRMLGFSSWNLFDGISFSFLQQGQNVILNRVFGVVINASSGIAFQIQAVAYGFIGNITQAFRPQIIKVYAQENYQRVNELIQMGTTISAVFIMFISLPIYFNLSFLMNLWLIHVPSESIIIAQILLIQNVFNSFNPLVHTALVATERIKYSSIFSGIIYFLTFLLVGISVYLFHSFQLAFWSTLFCITGTCFVYAFLLKTYMPHFTLRRFYLNTVFKLLLVFCILFSIGYVFNLLVILPNFYKLLLSSLLQWGMLFVLTLYFLFDRSQRCLVFAYIRTKIRRTS